MGIPTGTYIEKFVESSRPGVEWFVRCYAKKGDIVVYADPDEDKFNHWDVMINGIKYDVKDFKKITRSDKDVDMYHHWIEFRNGHGYIGWFRTALDVLLVFEIIDGWMIIDKNGEIVSYVEGKIREIGEFNAIEDPYYKPEISERVKDYMPYHRGGDNDSISLFTIEELRPFAIEIVKKVGEKPKQKTKTE